MGLFARTSKLAFHWRRMAWFGIAAAFQNLAAESAFDSRRREIKVGRWIYLKMTEGQKSEVVIVIGEQVVTVNVIEKTEVVVEIGVIAEVETMIDMIEIVDMIVSGVEIRIVLVVMIQGAEEGPDLGQGIELEIMIGTGVMTVMIGIEFNFGHIWVVLVMPGA